jgi:hypothetical protein
VATVCSRASQSFFRERIHVERFRARSRASTHLVPNATAQRRWQAGTLTYTAAGLVVLFCWLLWGDFAWSMKERSVAQVVQLLLKRFQASDTLAATLITSLPAAIGIFLGPIISYRSDRHRGRWGRRIPY